MRPALVLALGRQVAVATLFVAYMAAATTVSAQEMRWEEIGPSDLGGRVSAIAIDPSDPAHWIAGTVGGGLWQTHDSGVNWTPLTLWLATVPISAIAIDPADPDRILAGTGTIDDAGALSGGIGVLGTRDGGLTWTVEHPASSGSFVSAILIWPGMSQRILVATDLGIRLSTDGGASFAPVLDGDAVSTFARDPHHAGVVLASARSGLWRSADSGAHWTLISTWPLSSADSFGVGTTAVAIASNTPDLLYATAQVLGTFNHTSRALLLRSADGGVTFEARTTPAGFCPQPQSCGFAHALALDTDDRLLVGGEALSRSTDGGVTWSEVGGVSGVHQLAPSSSGMVAAGRVGVAVLDDEWITATRRNAGLAVTGITRLDVASDGTSRILAATADSGTAMFDAPASAWRVVFGADRPAGPARFDPFNSSRILASLRFGEIYASDDGGASFAPAQSGLDLLQPAAAEAPLAPSPLEPGVWYTGRLQMFRSSNSGASWQAFQPLGFPEVGLIAPSPVVPGRLYFAPAIGGSLYKTDLSTTDVEQLVVADEPQLRLRSLFLDPGAQNVMYAAGFNGTDQGGRVFKSSNFGTDWTNITPANLAPASSIVKDRYGALYVGARDGVWRSANDGYSWTRYSNGLFAGAVTALQIGNGWLHAGTSGRGVFRIREMPLVSIESTPPGVRFLVDGVEQQGPFVAYWEPGSLHSVSILPQNTADVREEFLGWADGGNAARQVTATGSGSWLMAGFKRSFRLSGAGLPAAGGSVEFAPPSADGFYAERSFVRVIPVPAPDYRVAGFGGDVSGNDGLIAYALMDRARTIEARFEPLRMTIKSEPSAVSLLIDGIPVTTPATYQWADRSTHVVSAPEIIGSSLFEPLLAFDGWTDLRAREHSVEVSRDTFMTDLTAKYVTTVRGVSVPPRGARTLTTPGEADAPKLAALRLVPHSGSIPALLQFVRGSVRGTTTQELVLGPSAARVWTSVYVSQDRTGSAGRVRLVLFNPTASPASVGVLLRDGNGNVQAARADAITVPEGAQVTAWLDELMLLPTAFKSLVTLIASDAIVASVHSVRGNWRADYVLDPILLVPFVAGDYGVSADARVQVVVGAANTTHDIAVINPGFSALTGTLTFHDAAGVPRALQLATGAANSVMYSLPPGGFLNLAFTLDASGSAESIHVRATPAAGQPAPTLQLTNEHVVGSVAGEPTVLPSTIPPSTPSRSFRIPVDRSRRETAIILTNTSPFQVTAAVSIRDRDGVTVSSAGLSVPAQAQVVVDALSLAPADFVGQLVVDTDIPVHGVGHLRLTNQRGQPIAAGFPAITEEPAQEFGALSIDGDSWQSEWWFINRAASAAAALLEFRGHKAPSVYFQVQ